MNLCYTGATFFGQKNALLSITQQIEAYHAGSESEARYQMRRQHGQTFGIEEDEPIPQHVVTKLNEHAIGKAAYIQYREAFKEGPQTVTDLKKHFNVSRQTAFRKTEKFADAGFIVSIGNVGRDVVWKWRS